MQCWKWIPTTWMATAVVSTTTAFSDRPFTPVLQPPDRSIVAQTPTPTQSPFVDIVDDVYATEILKAYDLGMIKGFPSDRTFRPLEPVTREQMVSILIDALPTIPLQKLDSSSTGTVPAFPPFSDRVTSNPFVDVTVDRWSAPKIQYAKLLGLVRGYADGTFRPTQSVTRAELMVMLQNLNGSVINVRGWDGRVHLPTPGMVPFYSDLASSREAPRSIRVG
jgi:S-layer homology domain